MTSQELDKIEAAANHHRNPAMKRILLRLVTECRTLKAELKDSRENTERLQEDHAAIFRNYMFERACLQNVREQRNTLRARVKLVDAETEKLTQATQTLTNEITDLKKLRTADQGTIEALRSHNKFLGERIADLERGKKKKCKAKPAVQNAPWITPLVFPALNTSTTTTMGNVGTAIEYSGTESARCKCTFFALMVEALRD